MKRLARIINITCTILAPLLPNVSMLALYFIGNLLKRLILALVLTLTFSTTVAIFTDARRIEIFVATAT